MKVVLGGVYSSYHVISDDSVLYDLFQVLKKYDQNSLLLDFFKKVVKEENIKSTFEILKLQRKRCNNLQKKLLDKIIQAYEYQVELTDLYRDKGKKYDPIRFVILDEPYCTLSRNIPLEDYGNNDGEPFWMRPQYILDHYSQTCGDYKYKD